MRPELTEKQKRQALTRAARIRGNQGAKSLEDIVHDVILELACYQVAWEHRNDEPANSVG